MAWAQLYDGIISGAALITPLGSDTAAKTLAIPYANGMRVLIMNDGT